MAKKNTIDEVLQKENFSDEEKTAFVKMISYAKIYQKGREDNLKSLIDEEIKGILKR